MLESALNAAFIQEDSAPIAVTEGMFRRAEQGILGSAKRKVGPARQKRGGRALKKAPSKNVVG